MANSIKTILIAGGGASGWIMAAFLNKFLDLSKCRTTLMESATLSAISVDDATVPPFVAFLRLMGINKEEFLRKCHATCKLGIKFIDWRRRGDLNGGGDSPCSNDSIWHPFGHVGAPSLEGLPVFHHRLRNKQAGRDATSYTSYSLQALLGNMNRAPRTLRDPSVLMQQGAYAYHLDAERFASFLASSATRRGVRHLVDDILDVALDEYGYIKCVETRDNGALSADLYIGCSGSSGLLIEKALRDPHIDWSDHLFCDRAVVLPLPRGAPMPPYTQAAAPSAVWAWKNWPAPAATRPHQP